MTLYPRGKGDGERGGGGEGEESLKRIVNTRQFV